MTHIAYAYSMSLISRLKGFTVVELLIVITVLTILASITYVGFSQLVTSSRNTARESDTKAWMSSFDAYKARFTVWPILPSGSGTKTICLGQFTNNKCGQYGSSTATRFLSASGTDYNTVRTGIAKVGDLYKNSGNQDNYALAGPIVHMWQTGSGTVTVNARFINFYEGECPKGSNGEYTASNLPSAISGVLTGLPSGTSARACYFEKSFTYRP